MRFGVGDPNGMHIHHVPIAEGQSFSAAVIALLNEFVGPLDWQVAAMELGPGEYYPRMARPSQYKPTERADYHPETQALRREYVNQMGQIASLIQKLGEICRYVHAEGPTLQSYGHEIRNLLILASTEVENQWRSIFEANGAKARTRRDYVKLQTAMKLAEYAIVCNHYPWLQPLRPFAGWSAQEDGDLPWYDAYNAVKHHREANFAQGTLEAALNAVAGCAILACAQFGARNPLQAMEGFFSLFETPEWAFTEVYVQGGNASPVARPYPLR